MQTTIEKLEKTLNVKK
jgi:hypothetical protein